MALDVIRAVHEDDAYANLLLPGRIARARLSAADTALATELCYGTLRMQGRYDAIIALAARRGVERIDPPVLDVLRLGAHQLLGMRTPAHAAVHETVALTRDLGAHAATGFVNGVLRALARDGADAWLARALAAAGGPDERRAVEHSHPLWVLRALRAALVADGRLGDGSDGTGHGDDAELDALLAADDVAPRVALVALPGLAERGELEAAGARPAPYSPLGALLPGGDPALLPAVAAGRARVQDEGSQLVALALARARPVRPGERWLEMCAGPGGKAALLAAEAAAGGARLDANELVPQRAELVRRALAVFDPAPEVTVGDGRALGAAQPAGYDRILLDAPCTGLGALRRRPEARWRKRPEDVAGLAALQGELLDSAVAALAPGGLLGYATCSPHPGETIAVIEAALARHTGRIQAIDTPAVLRRIAVGPIDLRGTRHAQLWPHAHGTDAMFLQLIARVDG
ncbi:MAG: transcription antitermination factor NusB [Microbacteriaceae bacterium]